MLLRTYILSCPHGARLRHCCDISAKPRTASTVLARVAVSCLPSLPSSHPLRILDTLLNPSPTFLCNSSPRGISSLSNQQAHTFLFVVIFQGVCWVWSTVVTTGFRKTEPKLDWINSGFGKGFVLFLFCVVGFQLSYMYLYVFP